MGRVSSPLHFYIMSKDMLHLYTNYILLLIYFLDGTKGVATSFYVSKFILDEHIPEIEDFRSSFLSIRGSFPSPLTQSSSSSVLIADVTAEMGPTIPLSELSSAKEVHGCWVYGQISSIISWKTWAYLGCDEPRCFKKVIKDNGKLRCVNCHKKIGKGIWRYNLRFESKP
ncbi:unnamed protein product [Cuscuta europaea]|uniref:Replication factor A C-terminal domain-containing protein n=1 Tax=Cuscuta europaea TaxID=41803 RepID=A0A9P0YVC9_CUSEU|nr:unnamed protein product [Cuscuta europaea]